MDKESLHNLPPKSCICIYYIINIAAKFGHFWECVSDYMKFPQFENGGLRGRIKIKTTLRLHGGRFCIARRRLKKKLWIDWKTKTN